MSKIVVFLNGQARQVDAGTAVEDMIASLKLTPRMVLVERNGHALLRAEWKFASLQHGDRLEIMRVVAGG